MLPDMTRTTLLNLLILLAALGLLDSLYLASHAVSNTALFCDIGAGLDGCNIVAQSPYSRFLGIPLAFYGVLFYALLLLGTFAAIWKHHRYLHRALLAIAGVGAVFSVVFLYVQLVLIQALCVYCIFSAVVAFASLGADLWLDLRHKNLPVVVP